MDLQSWLLFSSIAFIATITPGPAILLASTHSLNYGLKNTLFTIMGNITGLFIMSALSVSGLTAIILSSAAAFNIVKYLGVLYLIYLGLRLWRYGITSNHPTLQRPVKAVRKYNLYLHGLAVAVTNPKAIAFTAALFPLFIDTESGLIVQFSILIITFMFLSFTCIFAYAYTIQKSKTVLFSSTPSYVNKLLGAAFIISGVVLANTSLKNA